MEELQCALLGFSAATLPTSGDPTAPAISAELRSALHPTEFAIVMDVLPLGALYQKLFLFSNESVMGSQDGFLASALGCAVRDMLADYEEEVSSGMNSVVAVEALGKRYSGAFHALSRMTCHVREPEVLVILIQQFVSSLELPVDVRRRVGERVSMAVLFCIAHFVANGSIVSGRKHDFFIQRTFASSSSHESDDAMGADTVNSLQENDYVYSVNKRLLPCGIPIALAENIVAAGTVRCQLKAHAESAGGRLRTSTGQNLDDAARAILSSIWNASLTQGGRLKAEELEVRVEAARVLWSKALWSMVNEHSAPVKTVIMYRDLFLGHRGDLWAAFVEESFPALTNFVRRGKVNEASNTTSLYGVARSVAEAFRKGLRASRLEDGPLGEHCELRMEVPAPVTASTSSKEAAEIVLHRIQLILLNVKMPQGMELVIPAHAQDKYDELLWFQLTVRYSLLALHTARKILHGVELGSSTSSSSSSASSLSPQHRSRLARLLHFYTFVMTTVGYYFQVDVIEALFGSLKEALSTATSIEVAHAAHQRFLLEVAEAVFALEEKSVLHECVRDASVAAMTLYVLVVRLEASLMADHSLTRSSSSSLSVETNGTIQALEVMMQSLIAHLASHLSTSSHGCERALWLRLDFNRFFSTTWYGNNRNRSSSRPTTAMKGGSTAGMPLSLASLVNPGSSSRSSSSMIPDKPTTQPATVRLQSTQIPQRTTETMMNGSENGASQLHEF